MDQRSGTSPDGSTQRLIDGLAGKSLSVPRVAPRPKKDRAPWTPNDRETFAHVTFAYHPSSSTSHADPSRVMSARNAPDRRTTKPRTTLPS
jgi:hypothetical protein